MQTLSRFFVDKCAAFKVIGILADLKVKCFLKHRPSLIGFLENYYISQFTFTSSISSKHLPSFIVVSVWKKRKEKNKTVRQSRKVS